MLFEFRLINLAVCGELTRRQLREHGRRLPPGTSTDIVPVVTEYPDSGKIGVFGGAEWNQVLEDFYAGTDVSD